MGVSGSVPIRDKESEGHQYKTKGEISESDLVD